MTWKTGPEPRVPAGILATHLDRSLQLSYKLVMDALGHLRLQLVEALGQSVNLWKLVGGEKA